MGLLVFHRPQHDLTGLSESWQWWVLYQIPQLAPKTQFGLKFSQWWLHQWSAGFKQNHRFSPFKSARKSLNSFISFLVSRLFVSWSIVSCDPERLLARPWRVLPASAQPIRGKAPICIWTLSQSELRFCSFEPSKRHAHVLQVIAASVIWTAHGCLASAVTSLDWNGMLRRIVCMRGSPFRKSENTLRIQLNHWWELLSSKLFSCSNLAGPMRMTQPSLNLCRLGSCPTFASVARFQMFRFASTGASAIVNADLALCDHVLWTNNTNSRKLISEPKNTTIMTQESCQLLVQV